MKKLFIALFVCAAALAIDFAWDDTRNPSGVEYRLYSIISPGVTNLLETTTNHVASVELASGVHTLVVRVAILNGTNWLVSADCNKLILTNPFPVLRLRIDFTGMMTLTPQ